MSSRSSCRNWGLVTGESSRQYKSEYSKTEKVESALAAIDMEVAEFFLLWSVYAFCRLCGSFLNEALAEVTHPDAHASVALAQELRQLFDWTGFFGVYLFLLVGVVRCVVHVATAEAYYFRFFTDEHDESAQSLLKLSRMLEAVFSFLTLAAVVNMFLVAHTRAIKDKLGNANMKFTGARLLILCVELQTKALAALTGNDDAYTKAVQRMDEKGFNMSRFSMTVIEANLLHHALLNFECLLVAVFNCIVWRDVDIEKSGLTGFTTFACHEDLSSASDAGEDDDVGSSTDDESGLKCFK